MTDLLVGVRGAQRAGTLAAVLAAATFAGCAGSGDAPPPFTERSAPQALFVVHNELLSIRVDGTDRHSLGLVGDNKWRTGFPRLLPDGRAVALGDDTGAIYPFFQQGDRMVRLSNANVTLNDSICGANVMGAPEMVMTTTPFIPTRTAVERVNLDSPTAPELMHLERAALIANPAPYGDGRVVAVRYTENDTQIVVIDVEQPISTEKQPLVLTHIALPYYAGSPARLPDGRVAFIRLDTRKDADLQPGDLWIIETDGVVHSGGVDNIISMVAVEDYLVYESAGGNHFSDLVASNLKDPPVNVTNTPYISEHLGWSD